MQKHYYGETLRWIPYFETSQQLATWVVCRVLMRFARPMRSSGTPAKLFEAWLADKKVLEADSSFFKFNDTYVLVDGT